MCLDTFDIDNSTDTAVIMFKFRAVEALLSDFATSLIFLILSLQLLLPSFYQLPPAQIHGTVDVHGLAWI